MQTEQLLNIIVDVILDVSIINFSQFFICNKPRLFNYPETIVLNVISDRKCQHVIRKIIV